MYKNFVTDDKKIGITNYLCNITEIINFLFSYFLTVFIMLHANCNINPT
jgi:hypothetical protein